MEQILKIAEFIVNSFLHIWPYLLITIPLAVAINLSGAAAHIHKVFNRHPMLSVLLATVIGAISPFCSCGVIPVITSLLIGGVPLGPVMSFWIASPSMDPEIFMLSVASIGWKLSLWRLVATFVISLAAGVLTQLAQVKGLFGDSVLKQATIVASDSKENCGCSQVQDVPKSSLNRKIFSESLKSLLLVAKFMTLAFFINALIQFYLPADSIKNIIGGDSPWSVFIATLVGIPFYTTNLTALPLVSGLISLGMNKGAALAFLIAGPVTTLPAMMAVWGIVKPKVFFAFLSFGLLGSMLFGILFNLIH